MKRYEILAKSIRWPQTLFFLVFTFSGFLLAGHADTFSLLLQLIAIFFIWQFTCVLNDIHDEKIDMAKKPVITGPDRIFYMRYGLLSAVVSTLISIYLGFIYFILNATFLLLGFIYSTPPLRLRRFLFSTSFIGAGATISFLVGYMPAGINLTILKILLIIFIATTLGTNVKDLKDYKGDKNVGVKTLLTVFGKERGKKISHALLFISFLTPIILLPEYAPAFVFIALVSVAIFKRYKDFRLVMMLLFVVLFICMLGLLNIL